MTEPLDTAARLERAMSALGITFHDTSLLYLALVHRSYLNESEESELNDNQESNERLEFLGDSLVGFVAAEYVYRNFPDREEGALTVYRAALVRTETLAAWARRFGLDGLLLLARGEIGPNGKIRDRILAGVFEAVVGAIYLDQGIEPASAFLRQLIEADGRKIISASQQTNYKGRLQEVVQAQTGRTPSYRTAEVIGPAHDRSFVEEVVLGKTVLGTGRGANKRIAQQEAARNALERMQQGEGITTADGRSLRSDHDL